MIAAIFLLMLPTNIRLKTGLVILERSKISIHIIPFKGKNWTSPENMVNILNIFVTLT